VVLKIVPKAVYDMYWKSTRIFRHPMRGRHWSKSSNDKKETPKYNSFAVFSEIFRINKGILKSKQSLYIYIFPKRQPEIFKTNGALTKNTGLIVQTFKDNIHLMTLSL
jgi:hypothetical protein